jgi:hypothetical protein
MLITDLCQTALPVPITNEPQKYVIGDQAPLKFDLAPWIDSRGANKCGTIEYKVQVNGKPLDSAWIKWDPVKMKFTVKNGDIKKAGVYQIKVKGRLIESGKEATTIILLEMINPCTDAEILPGKVADKSY